MRSGRCVVAILSLAAALTLEANRPCGAVSRISVRTAMHAGKEPRHARGLERSPS